MISVKRHVPRRFVLRGLGSAIALPLLDSMVPAHAAIRETAANGPRRFVAIYKGLGANMLQWAPPAEGRLELSPILSPFAAFKDRLLVVSGLDSHQAEITETGGHSRSQATWLTGTKIVRTEGRGAQAGVSMDQLVAKRIGGDTQLTSLELAIEAQDSSGACEPGFTCAYTATMAWKTPTTPLPMEPNPRAVFERLFGDNDSTDAAARRASIERSRSILDQILGKVARLNRQIDASDRTKLDEYLSAVRDAERRIQKAEEQADRELPLVEQPVGMAGTYQERARLMADLLVLALQSDLTRVSTLLLVREMSNWTYPEIGISDGHHQVSHHQNDAEKLVRQGKVDTHHMQMIAYLLERLRDTKEGDGSLLDRTLVLFGSGMSNSNTHFPRNLPTAVVTGPAFGISGGRHVKMPEQTPLANLQLKLLRAMDVPVETFGDSTSELAV
jgi:hypothetical protein